MPTFLRFDCPLTALERRLRKKVNPDTSFQYFWSFYLRRKLPKFLVPTIGSILIGTSILKLAL
ncbi:MAG: hypothetical protein ACPL3E_02440 [Minisyncoccia bacterium]